MEKFESTGSAGTGPGACSDQVPNEAAPKVERLGWIDTARGVGIVAVVAGHVFTGTASTILFHFHMPLFFILSGCVFRPRPIGDWLRRRSQSLLIPYLAWGAVLTVTLVVLGAAQLIDVPRPAVRDLLFGGERLKGWYATFWFVTCLFAALFVYNLIRLRIAATDRKLMIIMPIVGAAGLIIAPHALPGNVNIAPIAMVLLWIGELYRQGGLPRRAILVSIPAALLGLFLTAPLNMKYGELGTPILSLLAAIALSHCALDAIKRLSRRRDRPAAIGWFAEGSLVIMFVHPAIYISLRGSVSELVQFALTTILSLGIYLAIRSGGGWPRRLLNGETIR